MSYLKLVDNNYPNTHSKAEAMQVLERYKTELTSHEYDVILSSLCSHAFIYKIT